MYMGSAISRRTPLAEKVYAKAAEIEHTKQAAQEAKKQAEMDARAALEAKVAELEAKLAYAPAERVLAVSARNRVRQVLAAVCRYYGLKVSVVCSARHLAELVRARQICMFISYEHSGASFPQIGAVLDRDHTTVISGVRKIQKLMSEGDQDTVKAVRAILHEMSGGDPLDDGNYWGA